MNGILIHSGDRPWVTIVRVRGRCPVTPIEAGGGQWSPSGQCHLVATSSAVLLRHSPLITDIHHKQQPEHKQQLSLYWKPVKKRNEKCLKEVWWRKALLPPRVRVRGGCHCVTPGPGCYTGSDVAAADSGHGRPPLAAEDRLRLVAGVLRAVPALWSALHWPPILPVSGVSAGLHRLYTDSILYSDRFFYRLALCSVQWTLDTGLGPSWAWVQTTLRPRHQMLYLARPHSQNIILFIIISCFPFLVYFLCVEPYPVALRASVALCVLSNTLNPWSTPLTAPRSPLRVVYKMQLTWSSRGTDHPDILFSMSSQLMFAPESL